MFVTLQNRFDQAMGQLIGPDLPEIIGVSVSGGGDSMALMHLAAHWAGARGVQLSVATIDHGLRAQSAAEAAMVAAAAGDLGLPHTTLNWTGWDGRGNLQDAARDARIDLLSKWRGPSRHILLGHTADDQAETFLMRLARGSGVEGLAAMRPIRHEPGAAGGFHFLRPLLGEPRADLRDYLRAKIITWIDDPSNDDPRFDRVKARQAMALLEPLGLTARTLVETTARMRRSQQALAARAADVAARLTQTTASGDLIIDRAALAAIESDTRMRLLAAALGWVSSNFYRPRAQALCRAWDQAMDAKTATLHGCLIVPGKTQIRITREFSAVSGQVIALSGPTLWDRRWLISSPDYNGLEVRALGQDGIDQSGRAARPELPHVALLATPSLWDGARLVAAPFAGFGPACEIVLAPPAGDFVSCLLSH